MNYMHIKFQSSILIDKKSFKIGGPVIGWLGPQKGPNLKIDALKTLSRAQGIFWYITCYPNLKTVGEI